MSVIHIDSIICTAHSLHVSDVWKFPSLLNYPLARLFLRFLYMDEGTYSHMFKSNTVRNLYQRRVKCKRKKLQKSMKSIYRPFGAKAKGLKAFKAEKKDRSFDNSDADVGDLTRLTKTLEVSGRSAGFLCQHFFVNSQTVGLNPSASAETGLGGLSPLATKRMTVGSGLLGKGIFPVYS